MAGYCVAFGVALPKQSLQDFSDATRNMKSCPVHIYHKTSETIVVGVEDIYPMIGKADLEGMWDTTCLQMDTRKSKLRPIWDRAVSSLPPQAQQIVKSNNPHLYLFWRG